MRAGKFSDDLIPDYARRGYLGPPPGHDSNDIEGVDTCIFITALPSGAVVQGTSVRIHLEEGDLEKITETGQFWLTFLGGHIPPFHLEHELPVLDVEDPRIPDEPIPVHLEPCGPCQAGTHNVCLVKTEDGDCCCGVMVGGDYK